MARPRRRSIVARAAAWLVVLAVLAAGAAWVAGVRPGFLRDSPPRGNYAALQQTLNEANRAARRAAENAGSRTNAAAAEALRRAIVYSRANARRSETRPIPPDVRAELEDFFSADLLDRVEWTLARRQLDLGGLVAAWYRRDGGAVTLRDVVVYSHGGMVNNRTLWAHELTHALQYEELGLRDFARLYVVNHELLERQARDNAARIAAEIRNRRQQQRLANTASPGGA